ncbi:MAG: tetratricopeptide repeat protein [Bacteroidales bacterium]|nr:tetratricopeptide repeat protein [Bacteroidales bacterium]MCF8327267.1 tetratricopeptide repeat protein [Bacteroidales bacterium]
MRNLNLILIAAVAVMILGSCTSDQETLKDEIDEIESNLFDNPKETMDKDSARILVDKYVKYAEKNPEDSLALDYMFKAARVEVALGNYKDGLDLLNQIEEDYEGADEIARILLLKGIIFEDNLDNPEKAAENYRKLIEKYPDNEYARDAQHLLDNLGKSLQDLIDEFEKKNEGADTASVS